MERDMSYDLAVWYPHVRLDDDAADEAYGDLVSISPEGEAPAIKPHPAVDAFYLEITSKYPEVFALSEAEIASAESPWAGPLEKTNRHVHMYITWDHSERMSIEVLEMAFSHGLAVFDPQGPNIFYPPSDKPWWKFW